MFKVDSYDGPIRAESKFLRPLHDDDSLLRENVLQPERLEIVEIADAV